MMLKRIFLICLFIATVWASCTQDSDCGTSATGKTSVLSDAANHGVCSSGVCLCNAGRTGDNCETPILASGEAFAVGSDFKLYLMNANNGQDRVEKADLSSTLDSIVEMVSTFDLRNDRYFVYGTSAAAAANNVTDYVLAVVDVTAAVTVETWDVEDGHDIVALEYDVENDKLWALANDGSSFMVYQVTKTATNADAKTVSPDEVIVGMSGFDQRQGLFFYVAGKSGGGLELRKVSLSSGDDQPLKDLPDDTMAYGYTMSDDGLFNGHIVVVPSSASAVLPRVINIGSGDLNFGTTSLTVDGVILGVFSVDDVSAALGVYQSATASGSGDVARFTASTTTNGIVPFELLSLQLRSAKRDCKGHLPVAGNAEEDWDCTGTCGNVPLCYNNGTHCHCPPTKECDAGTFLPDCDPCSGSKEYTPEKNYHYCLECQGIGEKANDAHTDCVAPTIEDFADLLRSYTTIAADAELYYKHTLTAAEVVDDTICFSLQGPKDKTFNIFTAVNGPADQGNDLKENNGATQNDEDIAASGEVKKTVCVKKTALFPARKRDETADLHITIANGGDQIALLAEADWDTTPVTPPPPAATPPPPPGTTPTTGGKDDAADDDSASEEDEGVPFWIFIIIGVVVLLCVVLVIGGAVGGFLFMKKKKEKDEEEMATYGSIAGAGGGNYGSTDAGSQYGSTAAAGGAYGSTAAAGGNYGETGAGAVYGETGAAAGGGFSKAPYAPTILREVSMTNAIDYSELKASGKVLGAGAFGVVKAGEYRGRKVAIKEIKPDNVDERELKAFVEEAELMQQLDQHENVVGFIGVVVDPFCIVSEFMGKGDLNTYIMSDAAIPDMLKIKILLDVAKGMNFLSKQGIVHRDLAARNILLDDEMTAKVSDFGLSRLLDTESAVYTKSATGPVKWMAPEQLTKRKASEKSDVWMYGVLIFEVVTRGPPYPDMNLTEVCVAVANNQLRPTFPESTAGILKELTDEIFNYDPEARPSFADIVVKLSSSEDKEGYVLAPGENR